MAKVSVVECKEYDADKVYEAVKQALQEIGFKVPKNKNVLLKPNVLGGFNPEKAVTTHPVFVDAVCRVFKEGGCNITIGESSGFVGSTKRSLKDSGIQEAADKHEIKAIPFESTKISDTEIDGKMLKKIALPEMVFNTDIVVNLPKLKTHSLMTYTGAVKNLFGLVPGGLKSECHCKAQTPKEFAQLLADIYSAVKPAITLNIMDAITGMEGNGPSSGTPKKTGILLASEDATALDQAALEITGLSTPLIEELQSRGLLEKSETGELPSIPYQAPSSIFNPDKIPKWLKGYIQRKMVAHPHVDEEKCVKCRICEKSCPTKAISLKPYPDFDRKKCIDCYCCHELCPKHAIHLKKSAAMKLFWKIFSLKNKLARKKN